MVNRTPSANLNAMFRGHVLTSCLSSRFEATFDAMFDAMSWHHVLPCLVIAFWSHLLRHFWRHVLTSCFMPYFHYFDLCLIVYVRRHFFTSYAMFWRHAVRSFDAIFWRHVFASFWRHKSCFDVMLCCLRYRWAHHSLPELHRTSGWTTVWQENILPSNVQNNTTIFISLLMYRSQYLNNGFSLGIGILIHWTQ
jgi:hypothetical protein